VFVSSISLYVCVPKLTHLLRKQVGCFRKMKISRVSVYVGFAVCMVLSLCVTSIRTLIHSNNNNYHGITQRSSRSEVRSDVNSRRKLVDHHVDLVDGVLVRSEFAKEIYLMYNGTKHLVPDFETFVKMKFNSKNVKALHELIFERIPLGEPLKSLIGNDEPVVDLLLKTEHVTSTHLHSYNKHHSRTESQRLSMLETGIVVNTSEYHALHTFLKAVEDTTSSNDRPHIGCYRDDFSASRDELLKNKWGSMLSSAAASVPGVDAQRIRATLVYPMCLRTYQLGNSLGEVVI
jgi:hypothetical protein